MSAWRKIVDAFKGEFGKPQRRPNPWPKCPVCWHRVPALCANTDDGVLCGFCPACCPGHRKQEADR